MTRIVLELPDSLAREAEAQGLLSAQGLASLVEREVSRRKHPALSEILDKAEAVKDDPPMTEEQVCDLVNEAIAADRAQQRTGQNARRT